MDSDLDQASQLPLKSVTLEKLEKVQKDANAKAKEMQEEIETNKMKIILFFYSILFSF